MLNYQNYFTSIILLFALLGCVSEEDTQNNIDTEKKIALIFCDLTIENEELISKVASDAKDILQIKQAPGTEFRFYLIDENPDRPFFKYEEPKLETKRIGDSYKDDEYYKKQVELEIERNDSIRVAKSDSLFNLVIDTYHSDFKSRQTSPSSCLIRTLYVADQVFKSFLLDSIDHSFNLIYLSDMVIKCKNTFCGDEIYLTQNGIDEALNTLDECNLELDLSYLDNILVVVSTEWKMSNDTTSLPPEEIMKYWHKLFFKSGIDSTLVKDGSFNSSVPTRLFKNVSD